MFSKIFNSPQCLIWNQNRTQQTTTACTCGRGRWAAPARWRRGARGRRGSRRRGAAAARPARPPPPRTPTRPPGPPRLPGPPPTRCTPASRAPPRLNAPWKYTPVFYTRDATSIQVHIIKAKSQREKTYRSTCNLKKNILDFISLNYIKIYK